jgi:GAF domain-containing protein
VRSFTDKQVALLQTFADQAVIAIENVRLFRELEARNLALSEALEQQTATAEILKVISSSPTDVQPVFETIVARAVALCGGMFGVVYRFDGALVDVVAHHGIPAETLAQWSRYFPRSLRPPEQPDMLRPTLLDGDTVHIRDSTADPRVPADSLSRRRGERSVGIVPIRRAGRVVGALAVSHREVAAFTDRRIALLQTFAEQAVIALENVRLFRELEAKNASLTEALEQQTATAEILRVISSSPADVQPVLRTVAETAARLCAATDAHIFQVEGDTLVRTASHGPTPFPPGTRRLDRGIVIARAVVDRRPVHVEDLPAVVDTEFPGHRTWLPRTGTRTILAVPLLREGAAIGGIVLRRTEVRPFTDRQIALLQTFADQAAIAIENVRLFKELEARNVALTEALSQQTATAEILRVISSSPTDVEPVFAAIVRSAVRLCGGTVSTLYRYDGRLIHLAVTSHPSGIPREITSSQFPRPADASSLIGRAIVERAVVRVADMATDPRANPDIGRVAARELSFRSMVIVPMFREDQVVGVITVGRAEPGDFSDTDIALLQTFADQAVIAVENVRLFNELEARNRSLTSALEQQTATGEILRVIASSPTDVQPVFATIARSASRLCDAFDVIVLRVDGDVLRLVAQHGSLPAGDVPLHRGTLGGRTVLERRPIHVDDLQVETDEYPEGSAIARQLGHRTTLSVPLLREGVALGNIQVRRGEVRPFAEEHVSLLQTFAAQAVIAIENVRLFQELQARTGELTRSVGELEALGEVGRTLSATLDLPTVLTTIATRAVALSHASAGIIYEFDEGASTFHLRATHNMERRLIDLQHARPVRLGEGAVGQAVQVRRPVQVEDLRQLPEYTTRPQVREMLIDLGYRSILAVPLLVEDRIMGALVVLRREVGGFAPSTVDLLRTFGAQSALAIQNARLFREIETKSRELQVANQHKDEFLASMSHELRTPLNAIIGFSEVLLERLFGDVNAKQEEYLNDILTSGRHLLSLINDILDLAKIEAGRMELEAAEFDLPQAIDNALVLVRERALRRGITLEPSIDPRLGPIKGDERKIKQVLLNLPPTP